MRDLSIIFLYSFSFYFLRLWLCPEALVNDEAQQFIDVANLALGYSKQAPLFTWFAALASSIFGLKIWLLSFLFHLYLFVFFLAFYFTMRYFQKANQALLSTAFLLLIPLYSYDLYRYMVHSVLMLACTALSLCLLVHLLSFYQELGGDFRLKLSLRWTYICLGISIALGILSKYNFLFFVLIR